MTNREEIIFDAIEASYYVSPSLPGLQFEELRAILSALGDAPAANVLDPHVSSKLVSSIHGYTFPALGLPTSLKRGYLAPFEGDPRSTAADRFAFEHVLAHGIGQRISFSLLIARGVSTGFDEDEVELAVHGLFWMGLAQFVTEASGCVLVQSTHVAGEPLPERPGSVELGRDTRKKRPQFQRVYQLVKRVVDQRPGREALNSLVNEVRGPVRAGDLLADDLRVLDRVLSHFADYAEPFSPSDLQRKLPDVDTKNAIDRLAARGLILQRSDLGVTPSLLSIRRVPRLFSTLLLLLENTLDNAREKLVHGRRVNPLAGASGLLPGSERVKVGQRYIQQVRVLLAFGGIEPSLRFSAPNVAETPERGFIPTLPALIRAQASQYAALLPRNEDELYADFLRATLSEAERLFRLTQSVSLDSIAQLARLDPRTAQRFAARARREGVVNERWLYQPQPAQARLNLPSPPELALEQPTKVIELLRQVVEKAADGQLTGSSFAVGTVAGTRPENQDRALMATVATTRERVDVAIVCDGIGGLKSGAECARLALSTFVGSVISRQSHPAKRLLDAARSANEAVHAAFGGKGGTTLSAIVAFDGAVFGCHVGDSRIYSVDGLGHAKPVSADDTVKAQLDRLGVARDHGIQAHDHLLQHVGMGESLQPHIFRIPIADASMLFVASDGAYRSMADMQKLPQSPRELVHDLLAEALNAGGHDNATVVAMRVPDQFLDTAPKGAIDVTTPTVRGIVDGKTFRAIASLVQPERRQSSNASETKQTYGSDTKQANASDTKRANSSDTKRANASDTKRANASDTKQTKGRRQRNKKARSTKEQQLKLIDGKRGKPEVSVVVGVDESFAGSNSLDEDETQPENVEVRPRGGRR